MCEFNIYKEVIAASIGKRVTLAAAESCTGGWIAKCLTDVPGSSAVFPGGVVAYSNALKQSLLQVKAETLKAKGAVSEATVREMVMGVCQCTGADIAVAVSGIAGPEGGTPDKPVGTVFVAVGNDKEQTVRRFLFRGDREAVRRQTVTHAAEMMLDYLSALTTESSE